MPEHKVRLTLLAVFMRLMRQSVDAAALPQTGPRLVGMSGPEREVQRRSVVDVGISRFGALQPDIW